MTKNQCGHINGDLSMCESRKLYQNSEYCKKHFADCNTDSISNSVQDKRCARLNETVKQLRLRLGISI